MAFTVTGFVDVLTYQRMIRYGRMFRINMATVLAAFTDSIVFPLIAFEHAAISLILAQAGSKILGGFVWSVLLLRFFRKRSEPIVYQIDYSLQHKGGGEYVLKEPPTVHKISGG